MSVKIFLQGLCSQVLQGTIGFEGQTLQLLDELTWQPQCGLCCFAQVSSGW